MSEQIEPHSSYWRKEPEITTGSIIQKALGKYINPEDAIYFPDNVQDAIVLLAFYIEQAGDDPELVLKQMGLLEIMQKAE